MKTAQSRVRGEGNGTAVPSSDEIQVRLQGPDGTEEAKIEGSLDIATEDKVEISVGDVKGEAGVETVKVQEKGITDDGQEDAATLECEKELEVAIEALKEREAECAKRGEELSRIQFLKAEIQEKALRLTEAFENARNAAAAADAEVAIAMSLAEESVAMEVEATQRVSDGEIALQKAEGEALKKENTSVLAAVDIAEKLSLQVAKTAEVLLLKTELKQEDVIKQESIAAEVEEKVVALLANLFVFSLVPLSLC